MAEVYTKVEHSEYLTLLKRCETLEKENATLKKELEKAITKTVVEKPTEEKTDAKKGGTK